MTLSASRYMSHPKVIMQCLGSSEVRCLRAHWFEVLYGNLDRHFIDHSTQIPDDRNSDACHIDLIYIGKDIYKDLKNVIICEAR